jgi:hypothetical protein
MMGRGFSDIYDDDYDRMTSISVSKQIAHIFSVLKNRKKLPSMEAVEQWLLVNLNEGTAAEIRSITDFLDFYPPFKDESELIQHFCPVVSEEEWKIRCDEVMQGIIAEKLAPDRKTNITHDEIREYANRADDERRKEGRAERYEPFFDYGFTGSLVDRVCEMLPDVEIEEKADK